MLPPDQPREFRLCQRFFSPPLADLKDDIMIRTLLLLQQRLIFYQALISTSTPEGKSNLLSASTVREEEV